MHQELILFSQGQILAVAACPQRAFSSEVFDLPESEERFESHKNDGNDIQRRLAIIPRVLLMIPLLLLVPAFVIQSLSNSENRVPENLNTETAQALSATPQSDKSVNKTSEVSNNTVSEMPNYETLGAKESLVSGALKTGVTALVLGLIAFIGYCVHSARNSASQSLADPDDAIV